MLTEITTLGLFHFFLVFCRLGSAIMLLPGFGETYVNARSRLVMALAMSFVLLPVLQKLLPQDIPDDIISLFLLILFEVIIGLFIGAIGRMIQASLHIAGMIIAFQSSLASALLFDATQGSQGSVIGIFLTVTGLTLLFVTDMHHLMITGIAQSYLLFDAGNIPPVADFADFASRTLSDGFLVAVKISSPLIVIGLLIYLAAGVMGRLMPQMQVFFVVIPIQVYVAFVIFVLSLSAGMMWYLKFFEETFSYFLSG